MPRWSRRTRDSLIATALLCVVGCARPLSTDIGGRAASTFSTPTLLDGAPAQPFTGERGSLALLFYLETGCPIANVLSPEIERISTSARESAIDVYLVYPGEYADAEDIRVHNKDFNLSACAILDRAGALVRATGVTISPEAALVRRDGDGGFALLYRGRINDLFETPGRRRPAALHHDLANAITAVLEGRAPNPARTTGVGCVITPPK